MTQPTPAPLPTPPGWPHCAHGNSSQDPVGCPGIRIPGHIACLAHLADANRHAYLASLAPGDSIDHRGTTFTPLLLTGLLNAVQDPATGHPRLGDADFNAAIFEGSADFRSAIFNGVARFGSAIFNGVARFGSVIFKGVARFGRATFEGGAMFQSVTFESGAEFTGATFEGGVEFWSAIFESRVGFDTAVFKGDAGFGSATFHSVADFESAISEDDAQFVSATFEKIADFTAVTIKADAQFVLATFNGNATFGSAMFKHTAGFSRVTFGGDALFAGAIFEGIADFGSATFERNVGFTLVTFEGDARFTSATFERAGILGPLVCTGRVVLSGAVFGSPITLLFAARYLECRRTRWSSTAEIRLRYTRVDFAQAVFEYPLTIAAEVDPFLNPGGPQMAETLFATEPDASVRVASLRGVDAAHLVLSDVDLSECLFTGTVHLDQVRLEGACSFAAVPSGRHWRGGLSMRFTQRRTLAEEHHWRAGQPAAVPGWSAAASGVGRVGPVQLAPVYRALRKAFEDGKHEPGAADFYYGEMEMRRHADDIPRGERSLLTAYWAMSGYGLRASRALGWLAACMLATVVLMMGFGLPQDDPKQRATGTVPAGGGKVTFEIDKPDPQNPTGNRFTGKRFEKALKVTLNSVVFRSSGQDLTTAGTYIEMTSRLTEPVLLGLAVLAVRNRVKR
ncbi:pentapeptide repeat-containing protein [Streptomyces sp. NPDC059999]|uniref:pentapeptide repeat-containing protein n=1 Tax=Streptomyces sp. NPDC059999 TaxID=3347030 RepID=UPI0036A3A7AB